MEEKIEPKSGENLSPSPRKEPFLEKVDQETWQEICEERRVTDALGYQKCLLELEKIKNGNKE